MRGRREEAQRGSVRGGRKEVETTGKKKTESKTWGQNSGSVILYVRQKKKEEEEISSFLFPIRDTYLFIYLFFTSLLNSI